MIGKDSANSNNIKTVRVTALFLTLDRYLRYIKSALSVFLFNLVCIDHGRSG